MPVFFIRPLYGQNKGCRYLSELYGLHWFICYPFFTNENIPHISFPSTITRLEDVSALLAGQAVRADLIWSGREIFVIVSGASAKKATSESFIKSALTEPWGHEREAQLSWPRERRHDRENDLTDRGQFECLWPPHSVSQTTSGLCSSPRSPQSPFRRMWHHCILKIKDFSWTFFSLCKHIVTGVRTTLELIRLRLSFSSWASFF